MAYVDIPKDLTSVKTKVMFNLTKRQLICFGTAGALIFQTVINIGMCTGVGPVIGLTLPFISYGATSVVSLYAMLGLVSGVYARPTAISHELYIRPPVY